MVKNFFTYYQNTNNITDTNLTKNYDNYDDDNNNVLKSNLKAGPGIYDIDEVDEDKLYEDERALGEKKNERFKIKTPFIKKDVYQFINMFQKFTFDSATYYMEKEKQERIEREAELKNEQYSNYLEKNNKNKIKLKKDKKEFDSADFYMQKDEEERNLEKAVNENEEFVKFKSKKNKDKKKFPWMKKTEKFDSGTYFMNEELARKEFKQMKHK